ncbi:MAG: dTMP kinase [Desulfobulbaceae bacterium]|nr:dTMP kinase [Desulfobulbaceae bacterium]HIJ78232.1 dTMP kinase [Deltaproteobacteria bacterium]
MTKHNRNRKGLFVVFEGIDGTGKTTQIEMLARVLEQKGMTVVATREPTDGQYGQKIRKLFQDRSSATPEQELQLFMDDRREHVREVVAPALAAGQVVLCDRYYFSTAAYQGAAGHDPRTIIAENEKFAPIPDLVIILEAPVAVGVHRVQKLRGEILNDFEQESMLDKVAAIFADLEGDYIRRVDCTGDAATVHRLVLDQVAELFSL